MTSIKTLSDLLTSPHPVAKMVRGNIVIGAPKMIVGCLDRDDLPVWFRAMGDGDRREVALRTLQAAIRGGWHVYVAQQLAVTCPADPALWDVYHWDQAEGDYVQVGWMERLPTDAAIWNVTDEPAERELMEVESYV